MGRKPKLTVAKQKQFVELLINGHTIISICHAMKIDPSTYRHKRRTDEKFKDLVDEAKEFRNTLVEDALFQNAISGNFQAQRFWSVNRMPDRWKNINKVELESSGHIHSVQSKSSELDGLGEDALDAHIRNIDRLISMNSAKQEDEEVFFQENNFD